MRTLMLNTQTIGLGSLILINRTHPLRFLHENNVPVCEAYSSIRLNQQAAKMFNELYKRLSCERQIVPVSGYRTRQEQEKIFSDSLMENGVDFTSKYVAAPNCSEHQTGFAIDLAENSIEIDVIRPSFPYAGLCQEFREKAVDYGFIERYQEGKEKITGISHEPWHFRYVGYPHSRVIRDENFALEEYVAYIKDFSYSGKHLALRYNNYEAEVFYIKAEQGYVSVGMPDNKPYQVSGNNEDGFIVTIWRNM